MAFGLDATVTLLDDSTVVTRVFWLPPTTVEVPAGEAFRRVEARRCLVVPTADVPQLARGALVTVPLEEGGTPQVWAVDEVSRIYDDHHRATVVPGVVAP